MARIRKSEEMVRVAASKRIVWLIAVYIRLSKEDGNDESLSVTNQKKIIQEYAEQFFEGKYVIVDFYIDGSAKIGLNQAPIQQGVLI